MLRELDVRLRNVIRSKKLGFRVLVYPSYPGFPL